MPAKYEAMRDKFIPKGMSTRAAKTKATKLFNSMRPEGTMPVTRHSDKKPNVWQRAFGRMKR